MIRFRTATIDSVIQWAFYTRLLEGRGLVRIIYGRPMCTGHTRRAFESETQAGAFRRLVAGTLGRTASGSRPGAS